MKRFAPSNHPSSRKSRARAQTMVEFALVMPLLLLLIYGILEVGRLMFTYSTVITASREAVRYGSASGMVSGAIQYKYCEGIRDAAKKMDFLNAIDRTKITIDYFYDVPDPIPPHNPVPTEFHIPVGPCPAMSAVPTIPGSGLIKVSISATFTPLAGIVPFTTMTLRSNSQRTILGAVVIK